MKGKLIIIVAPSGTGKSSLIEKLFGECPSLQWSISCTTRPIRPGEVHGKDYYFLDRNDFEQKIENKQFIEWAKVHSNYYGTLKSFVDQGLENGLHLLFDLDVQGCDEMKRIYGSEAKVIFIEPPSIDELEARLIKRGTESREVISERINNARQEVLRKNDFDYSLVNDDFDKAYNELKRIVTALLKD